MPEPFDLEQFCAALPRDIILMPVHTAASGPCGLWVNADGTDYIFYERDACPPHREHIVMHEIGHLLFDHDGVGVHSQEFARRLVPDLDPVVVQRVLGRSTYSKREEAEAEVLATLVLERAGRLPSPAQHADPHVAAQLDRVASALELRARRS